MSQRKKGATVPDGPKSTGGKATPNGGDKEIIEAKHALRVRSLEERDYEPTVHSADSAAVLVFLLYAVGACTGSAFMYWLRAGTEGLLSWDCARYLLLMVLFNVANALSGLFAITHTFLSLVIVCAAGIIPWMYPITEPVMRFTHGISTPFYFYKVLEISADENFRKPTWRPIYRVLYLAYFSDLRLAAPVPGGPSIGKLFKWTFRLMIHIFRAAGSWMVFTALVRHRDMFANDSLALTVVLYMLTYGAGTFTIIWILIAVDRLHLVMFWPLGVRADPTHVYPLLSESLRQFWSVRWNKVIAGLLRRQTYKRIVPIAGGFVAGVATFVASGFVHFYPWFLTGRVNDYAVMMFLYFPAQPVLLFIEEWIIPRSLRYTFFWFVGCTLNGLIIECLISLTGLK
eukprot:gnl/Spiro4/18805_TR10054_c0_g1_i1.p1 gnl/Spiro4/18805_TR10054_c0_g1~~gnl/Spiro4/18805_TR10054_c0_g1_i1.p1  ORF type:complete len:414 (-),score=54.78 gnl/Spiro4/18805_TR10054_c0_g1_i1:60-1259(-)